MVPTTTARAEDLNRTRGLGGSFTDHPGRASSAVSWGAIAAGAAAAASLSLILLILGVGLGLSSVSPWARDGMSATTLGVSTIVWLMFTQLLASGMGGYLAGRLRTKWTDTQRDEVYFRDTAHGFLSWAVASLATAALLTSVIGSIVGSGVQAGAQVVGGAASTAVGGAAAGWVPAPPGGATGYFIDLLFRRDGALSAAPSNADASQPVPGKDSRQELAEVSRIFLNVSRAKPLPAEDVRYVGQIVAQRTGLSQADAQQRVADVAAKAQAQVRSAEAAARAAADQARKASAYSALWLFVSLLVGAFCASLAATFGGRRRDA